MINTCLGHWYEIKMDTVNYFAVQFIFSRQNIFSCSVASTIHICDLPLRFPFMILLALCALNFNHSWSGTTNILPNSMVVFVLEGAVWTFLLFHLTALLLGPFLLSISQAVELHKVCKTLFNNTLFCIFRCVEICFSNPNYNVITRFVCLQHWVIP